MIAFIGVRISWLMLARKSDFMRVASSASFLGAAHVFLDALALRDVAADAQHALHVPRCRPTAGDVTVSNSASRPSGYVTQRSAECFPCVRQERALAVFHLVGQRGRNRRRGDSGRAAARRAAPTLSANATLQPR